MICFYDPRDPYGFFSNFSRHTVDVFERTWKTSEHAFQAMKFHPHRPDLFDKVAEAISPGDAATLGRDRSAPLRPDWELPPKGSVDIQDEDDGINRPGRKAEPLFTRFKDVIMYEVCLAKFSQHSDLKRAMLDTGTQALVENSPYDPYWGSGASTVGHNKLGRILMAVRRRLK